MKEILASPPNYVLRSSVCLGLLFVPLIISRLGFGTKRLWATYSVGVAGFFLVFAVAGWLVELAMNVMGEADTLRTIQDFAGISFVLAICSFCGGAFAEKKADGMRR